MNKQHWSYPAGVAAQTKSNHTMMHHRRYLNNFINTSSTDNMQCNKHPDISACDCPKTNTLGIVPSGATIPKISPNESRTSDVRVPHVVVMVGLPARGKTYMARKLTRYLNWIGINTKVFNLGEYRRRMTTAYKNHTFFRADNGEAMEVRERCAYAALEDVKKWIKENSGQVAVFDATNTTKSRRELIHNIVVTEMKCKLFYVESICNDEDIIQNNIRAVKLNSPDYVGMDEDMAMRDFVSRIEHYEKQYEELSEEDESHLSFMKIFNTGEKFIVHKHDGLIQARIVYYFMNTHVTPRSIYLSRHGESEYNITGRIGGDSDLSNQGSTYANELATYINSQEIPNLHVWTSLMKRTTQTASGINATKESLKQLNEIDAGHCEGLTYQEIRDRFPMEFEARDKNKLSYRYPAGESYEDLIVRLEPIIMEMERRSNVLVVAHQAVLRCLLAYFMDEPTNELPYINVPLHQVIKLTPVAYGCEVERINLNVPSVNTYRRKPEVAGAIEMDEVSVNPRNIPGYVAQRRDSSSSGLENNEEVLR